MQKYGDGMKQAHWKFIRFCVIARKLETFNAKYQSTTYWLCLHINSYFWMQRTSHTQSHYNFVAKALSFIPCIFRTHYLTIWSAPSLQRSAKFFVVEVLQIRGVLVFLRCVQLFYEFHCELTAIYLITRYFVVENNCYLWQLNLRFCKILSTTIVVRQLLWYRSVLAGPIHLNYTCFGCRTQLYQVSS